MCAYPSLGEQVGRFRIEQLLGSGGMGAVYLAEDTKLGVRVALKFLDRGLADAEASARFKQELLLARQVSHPGICRLYDIHDDDDYHFLSMEYVEGPTLQMLLRERGALPAGCAVEILIAVCRALSAAHALRIVHRDLKPGNILVRGRHRVSVLDFGLSKALGTTGLTAGRVAVGTFFYMAPEVASGEEATPLSDLYALGTVLYECVTGRLPFERDNVLDLQAAICSGAWVPVRQFVPSVPEALERVIARAMALRPEDRYPSIEDLQRALEGLGLEGSDADFSSFYDTYISTKTEPAGMPSRPAPVRPAEGLGRERAAPPLTSPPARPRSWSARLAVLAAAALVALGYLALRPGPGPAVGSVETAPAGTAAGVAGAGALPPDAARAAPDVAVASDAAPPTDAGHLVEQPATAPRVTPETLRAATRALNQAQRERGLLAGDLPALERERRQARLLERQGRLAEAQAALQTAQDLARRARIDRAFLSAKLTRFNAAFDREQDPERRRQASALSVQVIESLDAGQYERANRLLNEAFRALAASPPAR